MFCDLFGFHIKGQVEMEYRGAGNTCSPAALAGSPARSLVTSFSSILTFTRKLTMKIFM